MVKPSKHPRTNKPALPETGSARAPWLTNSARVELQELPLDGPGRVLVTRPADRQAADSALSIGAALHDALAGRTDSFAMVVGYFGHGGRGAYSISSHDLNDPVSLLLAELADVGDRDDSNAAARFKLLFGGVASRASALALELWWWLCRWRKSNADGADLWRRKILDQLAAEGSRDHAIALMRSLFAAGSPLRLPLLDADHPNARALLATTSSEEDAALKELQRGPTSTLGRDPMSEMAVQVGSLLLYLLQRHAELRHGARRVDGRQVRIFHPKLYVVERGGASHAAGDAFVFAGSANWSTVALDPNGDANIEVASVHRVSGRPFSTERPRTAPRCLGADLAATARALFDDAPVFARWLDPACCDIGQVSSLLTVPEHLRQADKPERPPPCGAEDQAPAPIDFNNAEHRRFAQAVCRDIELALGLDAPTLEATSHTLDGLEKAWHGKKPSAYQIDGAARLLALLQHSRGAMLTDEPGLGKTLIAQLVAAALIRDRLMTRRAVAAEQNVNVDALPPIRVSILAPARILGASGRSNQAATQWFRHKAEIISAVCHSLDGSPLPPGDLDQYLEIRLFSNQSLSRKLFSREHGKDKGGPSLRKAVVDELHHLACSEIVILDEAHNFRNGGGRATRLLRFCLSLPVWGESSWRAPPREHGTQRSLEQDGDPKSAASSAPPSDAPPSSTGRKILLLSATPFNNRIQDVSTQLGHFAKAQEWSDRPGDLTEVIRRRVDEAPAEAHYWRSETATKRKPSARTDFERLLGVVAPKHIPGNRALDLDDVKTVARGMTGSDHAKARDGGPLYRWAGTHEGLGRIFAAIGKTLAEEREGRFTSPGAQLDMRARIDSMLLDYVVQRSRRQVLDFVERTRSLDECARMFRAPKQPRAPLPIRSGSDGESDQETHEREILESLFGLVAQTDSDERRISMLAYELRYLRGFDRSGAPTARTVGATNFVAFQTVNLVKRLQSCPYAFLMTLVRGLLRTNLYELALVEALVQPVQGNGKDGKAKESKRQSSLHLNEDRGARLAGARVGCRRAAETLGEQLAPGRRLEQLGRLLGLHKTPKVNDSSRFFADLIGLGWNRDERLEQRFEEDLELARDYLEIGPAPTKKGRRTSDSAVPASHWVERLIDDLAAPPSRGSRIATDVLLCLAWVFGEDDDDSGLIDIVYEGLDGLKGQPMALVADKLRQDDVAIKWLEARLRADRRATDLLAWLLAQTAARLAAAKDPEARTLAPGGPRSLVFSEYADTIDYLRALLGALHRACARLLGRVPGAKTLSVSQTKRIKQTLEQLRARIPDICAGLGEEARTVLSSLGRSDSAALPPPLDSDGVMAQLPSTTALAEAALSLVEHAAIVTSREATGQRLVITEATSTADAESDDADIAADASYDDTPEADLEAGVGSSPDDSPALDAFSPWYQVDVTSAVDQPTTDVGQRLADAQRVPVYALLATEVLAEGVNLQECGVAVHYDLPWNPTRLIQRNGRVDRRIDPRVEQADARRELVRQLRDAASAAGVTLEIDAERFWPPLNVYHLTVPPIEPKLDDEQRTKFAKRVREVLFDKLSGIRRLFGLSAWPVVLGAADARQALDGSLAYETAAFVRREELFLLWRTLRERLEADTEPRPAHGAFTCMLDRSLLQDLHNALAEVGEGVVAGSLRGLALSYWSPEQPRAIPLRSGVDLAVFKGDETSKQAFAARWRATVEDTGGVMALALTDTDLVAWREVNDSGRTVLEPCLIPLKEFVPLGRAPRIDWSTLQASEGEPERDSVRGPTSPTATAELVLEHLARALRDNGHLVIRELTAGTSWSPPWEGVAQKRWLGPLLRRPLRDYPKGGPRRSDIEPLGFNIFIL